MKTAPMKHQITALERSDGKRNFAFLMEQGTGKTWTTLADAERCFLADKINAFGVIAPNGVHTNWVLREIPTHLSVPVITYVWRGKPTTKRAKYEWEKLFMPLPTGQRALRILAINIDAMNTEHGRDALEKFLATYRVLLALDESTRIKNPDAKRTKSTIKIGRAAVARRILSGTPLTKGPTDMFSQFDFLKEGLLGTTSYRAFVAEYSVLVKPGSPKMNAILRKLGGKVRGIPQVVDTDENGNKMWRNLQKLSDMIAPHAYRVRKEDCLDLPEKIYKALQFDLSDAQQAIYDRMKKDYEYTDPSRTLSFQAIATQTKLKQITSGFVNIEGEPVMMPAGENPRMDLFKEVIEDVDGQFIVWAMFEQELLDIKAAVEESGRTCVLYYGKTKTEDRERAIDEFQNGNVDVFIAHAAAAGIGLTLTAAETSIYYSCSYDAELRFQSEDRCHRIGTKNNVLYIDLIAAHTIDEDIQRTLAWKSHVADVVIDRKAMPTA